MKYDHVKKWLMHKLDYGQENERNKDIWNYEIQIDHPIPARKPYFVLIKKRTCQLVDSEKGNLNENERRQEYGDTNWI